MAQKAACVYAPAAFLKKKNKDNNRKKKGK